MFSGTEKFAIRNLFRRRKEDDENKNVDSTANRYREHFEKGSLEDRKNKMPTIVNEYYDLVTDLYEYGWGQRFHFAPRYLHETYAASLIRHEHFIVSRAGFKEGDFVLDVGSGVGGPARNIVRLTRCKVMGINNNNYQISRAYKHDAYYGMSDLISYTQADFCNMDFKDNTYSGAYAIEATCHATNRAKCYSEIFRVIKPGSYFVSYEWCITDKYDPNNELHRCVKRGIEFGNSLPEMESMKQVLGHFKEAGFEVEESFDIVKQFESTPVKTIPWYQPLQGNYTSLEGIRSTPLGRVFATTLCNVVEFLRLAPKGTSKATHILEEAAVNLVRGGELGIFTPAFFVLARKPLSNGK